MPFDRERDQSVDERRVIDAAGRPHLRVHADRGEPGDGVHFVDEDLVVGARDEEVDARHACAVDRPER